MFHSPNADSASVPKSIGSPGETVFGHLNTTLLAYMGQVICSKRGPSRCVRRIHHRCLLLHSQEEGLVLLTLPHCSVSERPSLKPPPPSSFADFNALNGVLQDMRRSWPPSVEG